MNWLDRALLEIAPRYALGRIRARGTAQVLLSYDGATATRRASGWTTSGSSANAEVGLAGAKLRERSRDLIRNNAYARRACSEIVNAAIGTGIAAQATTASAVVNAAIDSLWSGWGEYCDADGSLDWNGLQALTARTVFESGECLIRRRPRRPGDGFEVPVQIQILEPDFLDSSKTGTTTTGYQIQGVEFDKLGRRIGYWLFAQHPGDVTITNTSRSAYESRFVPADEIIHVYRKERPGQVRGIPWLAPVIISMRDLGEYMDYERVRKKIEACLSLFVSQDETAIGDSTTDATQPSKRVEKFQPGMVIYGQMGQKPEFFAPPAVGSLEYVTVNQREIAVGAELTYEQLTGDLSRVNYSSYRAGLLSFRASIDAFRWLCLIPMALRPARNWFVDAASMAGLIPEKSYATEWTPPSFGSVDPLKDAEAMLLETRTGRMTYPQACAEFGFDWKKQLDSIEAFNAELDRRGIVLDNDPRNMARNGGAKTTPTGGANEQNQNPPAAA